MNARSVRPGTTVLLEVQRQGAPLVLTVALVRLYVPQVPAGYYSASAASATYTVRHRLLPSGAAVVCTDCSPVSPAGSTSPSPLGSACAIGGYCSSSTSWVYTACPIGRYGVTAAGQTLSHACNHVNRLHCPTEGGTIADRVSALGRTVTLVQ